MKMMTAHDLYDSASDLAVRPRQLVSDLDVPEFDFSDAADSVVELAGDVAERAGDVAAVVGTESRRGVDAVARVVRRNPKTSIAVVAVVIALVAYLSMKKRSSDDGNRY